AGTSTESSDWWIFSRCARFLTMSTARKNAIPSEVSWLKTSRIPHRPTSATRPSNRWRPRFWSRVAYTACELSSWSWAGIPARYHVGLRYLASWASPGLGGGGSEGRAADAVEEVVAADDDVSGVARRSVSRVCPRASSQAALETEERGMSRSGVAGSFA